MTQNYKTATVFGGTGFIGRQIVRELAKRGFTIKVATRVPERAYFLKPCGAVGQVVPFAINPGDNVSVAAAVAGSEVVVNCTGILFEKKKGDFTRVHAQLPADIAKACKKAGVKRFVHISALGVDKANSRYAISKSVGEKEALKKYPQATILRPSIMFGEDDNFFNMFAELARYMPFLPLIGGGKTQFQPVFVGDVADSVMAALERKDTAGNIYELGGPERLSFKDIYKRIAQYTGRPRPLINLPFGLAKVEAFFLSALPKPLLTPDQVETLKTDNVVGKNVLTLKDLGVNAMALDLVLPSYLETYRQGGGRFASHKA